MIERNEELVTIFGGDGFIGRYVCECLFQSGVRVRVASRDPRNSYFIQPLGHVGQFGFVKADITKASDVRTALKGATAVINLVGVFGRKMHELHVEGARDVAKAAREAGTQSLVHISAIGANVDSPSAYGRTKGEGETAVRKAYDKAVIIRPSLVFGSEDKLTNRFAGLANMPLLPVIAANLKFKPVYVRDLARAITSAALEPQRFAGKTFEIGGAQEMSMLDLIKTVVEISGQRTDLLRMPDFVANMLSYLGWLPGAPLTRDQWLMLKSDNLPSGNEPGLEAFGIQPSPLAAVAYEWLDRFHKGGRFSGRRIRATAAN